jgi:subtilisin family serine protease
MGQNESTFIYHHQDPLNPEYLQGEILIKFSSDAEFKIQKSTDKIETGIENIDRWFSFYRVFEMHELFSPRLSLQGKAFNKTAVSPIFHLRFELSMDPMTFCSVLNQDSNILYAEPVYEVYSLATYPNDALYQSGEQWYLDEINAPDAWDSTTCDTTQVIAIIDSGVDWEHPDLDDKIWYNQEELPGNGLDDDGNGYIDDIRGWDFTSNSNDPDDDNGHGTHVAGVAAAETDNYIGIAGIAWNARIMPLKVLTGNGQGNTAWLTSAIYYAANNGATVVNMSLGTYGESQAVKDALLYAYDTLTLVGAAGNDNVKVDTVSPPNQAYAPMFPGCYPFVIGVEAGTPSGTLASFSNFDPSGFSETANPEGFNYEIIAPGVDIFSTFPGGGYRSLTGTSMASPIVAGAVALIKDFNPNISSAEVFARLIQFAQAGHLKIPNALHGRLEPDVFYVDRELVDTVGDADHDGHADSDETFDMWFTVKNAGGHADSVWAKLRLNFMLCKEGLLNHSY